MGIWKVKQQRGREEKVNIGEKCVQLRESWGRDGAWGDWELIALEWRPQGNPYL